MKVITIFVSFALLALAPQVPVWLKRPAPRPALPSRRVMPPPAVPRQESPDLRTRSMPRRTELKPIYT